MCYTSAKLQTGTSMSELLQTIAAYVPPHLVRATLGNTSAQIPDDVVVTTNRAAVLFADVSGFTPLTEALGQRGSEGPEELTRLLNRYFGWMIAFIEAEGGEIVKFGGDALTVVFPATQDSVGVATRRAFQAAQTMQSTMDEFGIMESSVGLISLRMKFGIGTGLLTEASVGGVSNRWEYIIAGDALFQATSAERTAQQGEIVLSEAARAVIHPEPVSPKNPAPIDWNAIDQPAAVEKVLRGYVPRPILAWLDQDLHGWLATLRPMTALFVGIYGLDYSQPDTMVKLHRFTRGAQEIIYHYQGSMPRLTIDDKGTVVLILFGAPPYSHEDDPERAVRCALDMHTLASEHNLELAIGVTTGRVFAGPVGGFTRREYTVMGDTVNLAARLMGVAGRGQIRCNYETYRGAYGQIDFELLPAIKVKGKSEPIQLYRPVGSYQPGQQLQLIQQAEQFLPMIGRQAETKRLAAHIEALNQGQGRVILVEGEAGIGKTQLIRALAQITSTYNVVTLVGFGRSIEQDVPFLAWYDVFRGLLGSDDDMLPDRDETRRRLVKIIATKTPQLTGYLPLLDDIFDLGVGDTALTAALPPERRKQLLKTILLAIFEASARESPIAIILEAAQWLDNYSWQFTLQLAQGITERNIPVLLVIAMRPIEDRTTHYEVAAISDLDGAELIRLDILPANETLTLVTAPMGLTRHELPEAVAELIRDRAGGNPFFAEELFYFLHQNSYIAFKSMEDKTRCLLTGDISRAAQSLPATIQSTILSRLDLLPPEKQLMLKVAAVIGQVFPQNLLQDTLRDTLGVIDIDLKSQLDDLVYLGFIRPDTSEPVVTYAFKHIIIREVIYQSLLFDRRRQLHREVAMWYEEKFTPSTSDLLDPRQAAGTHLTVTRSLPPAQTPLAPYYSLLAYHWHQAEDEEREQFFVTLLGEQAVSQYANAEALGYLSRALDLTPDTDLRTRYKLLLARETVYNRRGDRERQLTDLKTLTDIVGKLKNPYYAAIVSLRHAACTEMVGQYDESLHLIQNTLAYARQSQDAATECRAYLIWSRILSTQGKLKDAKERLNRAKKLARKLQLKHVEADVTHHFAMLNRLTGNHSTAREQSQLSLKSSQALRDQLLAADNFTELGHIASQSGLFEQADEYFEQALPIFFETGYTFPEFEAIIGLGQSRFWCGRYEAARDYYEQALDIARSANSQSGMATALSYLGNFYSAVGDYPTAQSYVGQALGIRRELGMVLGEAEALSQLAQIYYKVGDYRTTRRYCELAMAKLPDNATVTEANGVAQTYLGHTLVVGNTPAAAVSAYQAALDQWRNAEKPHATINPLAGLAVALLAEDNDEEALDMANKCQDWLNTHSAAGVDSPGWVYLKLYHIFRHTSGPGSAQQIIDDAYQMLQENASGFTDTTLKYKYLNQVKEHQDILTLWSGQEPVRSHRPGRRSIKTKESFLNDEP
jgi:predicted ATPase/class 3 adenylate cyclase